MFKRNLIIGLDGTSNETNTSYLTNVAKILNACNSHGQEVHYEEGVGTAFGEKVTGGVLGKGVDNQVLGAYRFLQRRCKDQAFSIEDNVIFIFGFSRGAYAARRLAGLINFCGIPKNAKDTTKGWKTFLKEDHKAASKMKESGDFFEVKIEMVGVWDTVKSTLDKDFHDQKIPKNVKAGYHAVALDEKRKNFDVLKWNKNKKVTQVWFPGVHSDIGGSYKEHGLSDIALMWMVRHAHKHGMRLKASSIKKLTPNSLGKIHESYKGVWKALGSITRKVSSNDDIHGSVKKRMKHISDYRPSNIPKKPSYV